MGDDGFGEVGAPDRLARLCAGRQHGLVELELELTQGVGHCPGSPQALRPIAVEPGPEVRVLRVEPVAEDVEILGAPVERRDLDPGDEPDAPTLGFGCGLGDAVDRVMVGEREQLDARLRR
jgi:hypothetical protein